MSRKKWSWILVPLLPVAVLALGIGVALTPPTPLPTPARGVRLDGVTLVEPGIGRHSGASLEVDPTGTLITPRPGTEPSGPFAGSFVLPGLTDMHLHMPAVGFPGDTAYTALLLLSHGVTTARILGGTDPEASHALRNEIATGALPGPAFYSCGPFLDGANPVLPGATEVTSPEQARRIVADLARRGVDCIKAYDKLDRATALALVESAREHGLPIVGHTPQALDLEDTHLQDVQHLRGVHPPFAGESMDYPHFLEAWGRMDEARIERVIEISRAFDMAYTPTFVAIRGTLRARNWPGWRESRGMRLWLPHLRDAVWSGDVGFNPARFMTEADFATVETALQQMQRTVGHLYEAGIPLHTGTDANAPNVVPGASLVEEIALFATAGLTPEQALALSTRASPRFLGVEGAGTLRPGAPANFVLYRDDPTTDLTALERPIAVVADGRLYTREDLDARLARYRAHYEGAAYQRLVMPLLRTGLGALTASLRGSRTE